MPHRLLFARSNPASGVRTVITLSTGREISSNATRCACMTTRLQLLLNPTQRDEFAKSFDEHEP